MRRGRLVIVVGAMALACAPAAHAATLSVEPQSSGPGLLHYAAAPGEANALTIDVEQSLTGDGDPTVAFHDDGAQIQPGGTAVLTACVFTGHDASCDGGGAPRDAVEADLGDGNDSAVEQQCLRCFVATTLNGGPGDDHLSGLAATLIGGPGADDMSGQSALVDYQDDGGRTEGVTVSLDDGANDGAPGEGDNVHSDVGAVWGTAYADTITAGTGPFFAQGSGGDDTIRGGPGDDTLYGGDGNDRLWTDGGLDIVDAGNGNDYLVTRDGDAEARIGCGPGRDTVIADAVDTAAADCEKVRRG